MLLTDFDSLVHQQQQCFPIGHAHIHSDFGIYKPSGMPPSRALQEGNLIWEMHQSSAAICSYTLYEGGRNISTTPVIMVVANNNTGVTGSLTISAKRTSSMVDTNHRVTLSTPIAFATGEELLLLHKVMVISSRTFILTLLIMTFYKQEPIGGCNVIVLWM